MTRHRQTPPAAPRATPRRRRSAAVAFAFSAAAWGFSGCIPSGLVETCGELRLAFRTELAAEKAYLHREDIFHECCSSPKDFKHGFKNGYVQVALRGEDCCAPPVPPKCFWGSTSDPCGRAELINCYYDGWAHGAIAAGQDGVAGAGFVPIRNVCDPGGNPLPPPGPPPGAPGFGPNAGPAPPAPVYGPDGTLRRDIGDPAVPPAPLPLTDDILDAPMPEPLDAAPTPEPFDTAPTPPPEREGSGGNPELLNDMLDAAEPVPGGDAPGDPFGRSTLDLPGPVLPALAPPPPAAGTATLDLPARN